ncbi:MAG: BofC C-terminal domain-containing protein [Clostridia bacterium]|nr:BofC C-terminal domain-containing protein [Clostridia bacterium]
MKRFFRLFLTAGFIFAVMFLCATAGFQFVKNNENVGTQNETKSEEKSAHADENQNENENSVQDVDLKDEILSENFYEGFPYHSALLPRQDIVFEDTCDYLVISENGSVNMYILTDDNKTVFAKKLDIAPDSLLDEDKVQLEKGIILSNEHELASLLEDYTS